ncbi:hypothetical protein ABE504_06630 [Paenibacillus oryzisoli]|uniref:PilN domain-containing protein n=1 Tax=Paenibacillus oryzisoli TaxID=1850517 RepID=UPI003D2E7CF6
MSAALPKLQSIEINLLQMRHEEKKGPSPLLRYSLLAVLVLGIGSMGWSYGSAKADIRKTNAALERVNQQIKEGQARLASSPTAGAVSDFIGLPKQLMESRPLASEVLDKLTTIMPLTSNLTSLTFGDGNKLKVTGNFATSEDIVTFMQAAKASVSFTLIGTSGMNKVAMAEDKNALPVIDPPLPMIQATFDLTYNADKKG